MDAMLQHIKLKKKLEFLSNVAKENQELKESVEGLSQTVEGLKATVDNLQKSLNKKVDGDNILDAIVYAIEEVKEID
ncbi:hypothetical protein [Bacillus mycoides]|uniref:hypothetical protein n=1 Tax=Bacillus mycoides TaxID=1405 RepID=UPI003A811724